MEPIVIKADHLIAQVGNSLAIANLSFEVLRGQIFGILGPPGSGKTTAVHLVTGALTPSHGELTVLGSFPSRFTDQIRQKIGYMPKKSALYPKLTVWENLCFAASLYGMGPFRRKRLRSLLDFVGAADQGNMLASKLSMDACRRISLAAALVHNPELVILDQPTAGLDPELRSSFWECLVNLRQQGRTLLVTTQYASEASYCDLVGVLEKGSPIHVESPEGMPRDLIEVSDGV